MPNADPPLAARLAPTGPLRACINLGNAVLARAGRDGGRPSGVSVDLAEGLAAELGVPLELVVVDAAGKSVDAVATGRADVGFFAIDPLRGEQIAFTEAYVLIEGAYLVRDDSAIRRMDEVDRPGTTVVVGGGSAYDLHLSRTLQAASMVRAPTSQAVVETFLATGADVAAGVRQQLEADAARQPGLRLVDGAFMTIRQAMGLAAGADAGAIDFLRRYVEAQKASGFVAAALTRHGIDGAQVAPPAG